MSQGKLKELLQNDFGLSLNEAAALVSSEAWRTVVKMLVHRRGVFLERIEYEKDARNITLLQGKLHENRMLLGLSDIMLNDNRDEQ